MCHRNSIRGRPLLFCKCGRLARHYVMLGGSLRRGPLTRPQTQRERGALAYHIRWGENLPVSFYKREPNTSYLMTIIVRDDRT